MELDTDLLNRIKNEVAKENGETSWYPFSSFRYDLWPEVCQRYAEAANKELTERLSELIELTENLKEQIEKLTPSREHQS